MRHLFQISNAAHSEGMKRFCLGLRQVFPELSVWVEGEKSEKAYFSSGTADPKKFENMFSRIGLKKQLTELLQKIPAEKIFLTDLLTQMLIDKSHSRQFEFVQILDRYPEQNQALIKSDRVSSAVAFSQTIADAWTPYYNGSIEVAFPPHPDPTPKDAGAHHSFIVGVITDLIAHSGVEAVIQALHRNREILPQVTLIFVGDGPEKKRLLWLVEHLHLRQRVQFVTSRKNYHGFLENFDVVVFPDEQPPAYNPILIDSMAQGIPVLASSIGFNKEIVEHGNNGMLFEPQNSHTLAGHLLNLFNNPSWRDHYKQKGPQYIREHFSNTLGAL